MKRTPSPSSTLEQLEPRQLLAAVSWDGGGDGASWSDPLNWSADVLPGPSDDVIIAAAAPTGVHLTQSGVTSIHSLHSIREIDISAGTLSVTAGWRQSAPLSITGGHIVGGDVIINGAFSWTGGTIDGTGNLLIYPGATLTIAGDVTLGRGLINNGSLDWASGNITAIGAMIRNLAQSIFRIESPGAITGAGAPSFMTNYGTLVRDGTAGSTTTIGIPFNNLRVQGIYRPDGGGTFSPGVVSVQSGTLSFTAPVTQKQGNHLSGGVWQITSSDARLLLPGGNIDIADANTTIELDGPGASFPQLGSATSIGTLSLSGGRAFTFSSSLIIGSLILDNPGTMILPFLHLTGDLLVIAGDVSFPQGLTADSVTVVGGLVAPPPTLTLGGVSSFNSLSGGSFSSGGLVRLTGELDWGTGTMSGPGQLLITPTGHLVMDGAGSSRSITRRIVNYGIIDWNAGALALSGELVNRGTFNINTAGFLGTAPGRFGAPAGPGYITNLGTINKFGNGDTTLRAIDGGVGFFNDASATVNIHSGRLIFNGGAFGGGAWNIAFPIGAVNSELVFGGLPDVLTNATFAGRGSIRVATTSLWTNATVNSGALLITAPGQLALQGTDSIASPITNNGAITLGDGAHVQTGSNLYNTGLLNIGTGDLHIAGDLTLTAQSTLRARSTLAQGSGHITVDGRSTLAGNLITDLGGPYFPGITFNFLTTGTHAGTFASATAPALPVGEGVIFRFVGNIGQVEIVRA